MSQTGQTQLAKVGVNDIRPHDTMAGYAAAEQKDIDWLKARSTKFESVHCPACGANDGAPFYEDHGKLNVVCRVCDTQYANLRPSARIMQEFYAQSATYTYYAEHIYPASSEARRERLFVPRANKVREVAENYGVFNGTLVEVGAGYGLFCDEVRKLGIFERTIGIEPMGALAQICRDRGIEVIESCYEKAEIKTGVDAIAHFEVIQLLFCPEDFLKWCGRALKPGGFIISTCPNVAGLESTLLGGKPNTVAHEYINLFTPQSLSRLHERCGFEVVEVTTPGCLDLDLIRRAISDHKLDPEALDPIVRALVEKDDPEFTLRLTKLLQEALLTSNMMMVARKPA